MKRRAAVHESEVGPKRTCPSLVSMSPFGEQSGHRSDQQYFGDGARQHARGRHSGRVHSRVSLARPSALSEKPGRLAGCSRAAGEAFALALAARCFGSLFGYRFKFRSSPSSCSFHVRNCARRH